MKNQSRNNTVALPVQASVEKQDDTSLDDQIRRCREEALRQGLIVDEQHIYTDAAISGLDDDRPGYRQMMSAWASGALHVVLVDEFSRLSRDPLEQARLMKKLEQHARMRLVTVDGVDTKDSDWQLRLGIQGVI
ncbi:recombinase family protein, partial [Cutibacterium acnes]